MLCLAVVCGRSYKRNRAYRLSASCTHSSFPLNWAFICLSVSFQASFLVFQCTVEYGNLTLLRLHGWCLSSFSHLGAEDRYDRIRGRENWALISFVYSCGTCEKSKRLSTLHMPPVFLLLNVTVLSPRFGTFCRFNEVRAVRHPFSLLLWHH